MIASRRKADKLRAAMRMRGIDESRLARLEAPTGPDAGAKTPREIALVSMVGVLAFLRGRAEAPANGRDDAADARAESASPANDRVRAGPVATEGKFINPVCGIAVATANPKHVETHEGVAYYFCCDCCWTTFRENPAKYAPIYLASTGSTAP